MRGLLTFDPPISYGIAFAIFCLCGAITVTILNKGRAKRRSERLRVWAGQHGYDFRGETIPAQDLAPMTYLKFAEIAQASNVMRRDRLVLFDLQYRAAATGGGRLPPSTQATCALFPLEKPLPKFSFIVYSAEPKLDDLFEMIRQKATDLFPIDQRPGFFLRAPNLQRVAPLFEGERARFFDDKVGWAVEAEEAWLLVSFTRLWNYDVEQFVQTANAIHDHFAR